MRKLSFFIVTAWFIGFSSTPVYASQQQTSNNTAGDKTPVILILGDSLSAAYGIERSNGWVNLLQQRLSNNQYSYHVVNASISGETTQGGLQRLPALLTKHQPALVILELGGNDGLRGLDIEMIKSNLQSMISRVISTHTRVLLLGIHLPPNYGKAYTDRFAQIYVDLGKHNKIPVVPFLLAGIATDEDLMQRDDIHPTAEAQALVLKNVWSKLEPLLKQMSAK
ncbi:MAG: arylesterase [Gammaproteobacteria bacterium]|jgi:acyl-CoA thioesterase-1